MGILHCDKPLNRTLDEQRKERREGEEELCSACEVYFESLQHHSSILAAAFRDITRMCSAEGTVLFVLDVVQVRAPSTREPPGVARRLISHPLLSVPDALGFSSLFENASLAHDQSVHPAQTPCIKYARYILMKCTVKLAVQLDRMRFLSLQPRSSVLPTSGRKLFQPDLTLYGHHNQLPSHTNK